MGLSVRQVRRVLQRYREGGGRLESLAYQRGRPAPNALAEKVQEEIRRFHREYPHWSAPAIAEALLATEGVSVHRSTVHRLLHQENGRPFPRQRRPARRFEMHAFGELWQMDTTVGAWLEGYRRICAAPTRTTSASASIPHPWRTLSMISRRKSQSTPWGNRRAPLAHGVGQGRWPGPPRERQTERRSRISPLLSLQARLRVWLRIEMGDHPREIKDLRQVWGAAGPAGDGPAPGLLRPTRSSASSAAYRLSRSRPPARPFFDLVLLRLLDILAALFLASHCVPPSAFVRIVRHRGD